MRQFKGFGAEPKPKRWLLLVYADSDRPDEALRFDGGAAAAMRQAAELLKDADIDHIQVLNGKAHLTNIRVQDIWADCQREYRPGSVQVQ